MLIVCACGHTFDHLQFVSELVHGMQFGHGFRELWWRLKGSIFVSVILAGSLLSRSKTGRALRGGTACLSIYYRSTLQRETQFLRKLRILEVQKPENFLASQGRALRAAL